MKLPAILRRKTISDVEAEGRSLQAHAEATAAEIARLDAGRAALVLDGEPEDVVAHDAASTRLAIQLEQATARLVRLDDDRQDAEARAEDDRRRGIHAAAKKRRSAGVDALAAYEKHAKAAADALLTLVAVEQQIADANDQLPNGFDPIAPAEPDNSTPPVPDRFIPPQRLTPTVTTEKHGRQAIADTYTVPGHTVMGSPGRPHQSILQRSFIAGLAPGDVLFGSSIFGVQFR